MEAARPFFFLLCNLEKDSSITYRCVRGAEAGGQLKKLWPRLEASYYSSEAGGQEFVERQAGTGPAVTGTASPGIFQNSR